MADDRRIARSPITPKPPVTVAGGWEVSAHRSNRDLRMTDATPLTKTLVRASADGDIAELFDVPLGHAARNGNGVLVSTAAPGEWWLIGPPQADPSSGIEVEGVEGQELVSILDLTHERAAVRLTGAAAPKLLEKVCAIDLSDRITPNGAAFRSSVARVVTDIVRDDSNGERSYLLHFERSYGQYLFDALLDAGGEFSVDVDGFVPPGI
ncbi:MAG: hypothetical protein H0U16_02430 [Actinobacteria bacterium]|nr:hypothetical protein [Actinomycetota bacterium]